MIFYLRGEFRMRKFERLVTNMVDKSVTGISRREFFQLAFTLSGVGILTLLGINVPDEIDAGACPGTSSPGCSIPCDSRPCCKQYANHWTQPCGMNNNCPSTPCGAEKRCYKRCVRYCYPNQCKCDYWTVIQSSYACIYCESGQSDNCQSCNTSPCPSNAES